MKELKELITWANNELNIPVNMININSKELLKACIINKKEKYIKLFNSNVWDKEIIDLYLDNIKNPIYLSLYIKELQEYYLLGLLKRKKYNAYLKNLYVRDETKEMQDLFFSDLENADIDYEIVNSKNYFEDKERLKKAIEKRRMDLLLNVYQSSYDEEIYTLLEGKIADLDTAFSFFGRDLPDHFLINHDHKLFKELIENKRYKYLQFIRSKYIEAKMEDQEMYDYIKELFFSLPDTQEFNTYFFNTKLNKDKDFLKRLIEEERTNFLSNYMYYLNECWTKENQKLYYKARENNSNFPRKETNYSIYVESYFNKPQSDSFYNRSYQSIEDNNNLNDNHILVKIAEDLHNNVIHTDNVILRNYYEFIYQTKSPRIIALMNFLTDKNINNLNLLFDSNGITSYFKEQLLYDQDYLIYCFKNNIDVLSDIKDINHIMYAKITVKYIEITKCVLITQDDLEEYINNGKITRKLVDKLFNPKGYKILLSMIENNEELQLNEIEIYVLNKVKDLKNDNIKSSFLKYCIRNSNTLTKEEVDKVSYLIERVIENNSNEITKKSNEIISEILKHENSEERLDEIEEIFDEDNIPEFAKRFVMYKILYSNNLQRGSIHSPMLSSMTDEEIDKTTLFDLFKISLGSFDDDLMNYLEELTAGESLFRDIKMNTKTIDSLTQEEQILLNRYRKKIDFISKYVYNFNVDKTSSDQEALKNFEEQLKEKINYQKNFPLFMTLDEIVKELFGEFGYTSMIGLNMYAHSQLILKTAFEEGRHYQNKKMKIEEGDFLKAVEGNYLDNILQYGSICKEMLGEDAGRDQTHMDTDMSIIRGEDLTIPNVLKQNIDANSSSYGKVKLVISKEYMDKYDNCITTIKGQELKIEDRRKTEIFPMYGDEKKTHYGIRTGFPSTYIKAIITDEYINSIKFKIVRSGFYIPVYNTKGELVFSYDEYVELSSQRDGLKKYHNDLSYKISENLETNEIVEISNTLNGSVEDATRKRQAIYEKLNEVFEKYFKGAKYKLDGSITPGIVEIYDTGSTGRGTNVPNDSDYDFILRVDKKFKHSPLYNQFISDIYKAFGKSGGSDTIRLENVKLDGIEEPLDIDITPIEKTNKVTYSTDECIKDRLATIKEKYPDKYNLVISNIIMAKKLLKEAKAYKPWHAGKNPQGGLGGVGVENWILQHGGSLLDAAQDFVSIAEKCNNDFKKFVETYPIYDFGENHRAIEKNKYLYDNFVKNLDSDGFQRTVAALKKYILNSQIDFTEENIEVLEDNKQI